MATKILISDGRIELTVVGCWTSTDAAEVLSELSAAARLPQTSVLLDVSECDVSRYQLACLMRSAADPAGLDLQLVSCVGNS